MSRVVIGIGMLRQLGAELIDAGLGGRVYLFSDSHVYSLHGAGAELSIREAGLEVQSRVLPAGERTKSLETAFRGYDWLIEQRAERRDIAIALGGGVIGDLVGFIASTYLRGMSFVQVPTTLIAQIDSSIGGKVAVNHPKGKNLIGAFKPAELVLIDTSTLSTLPPRDLASGWAEVIKTAFIRDEQMLATLESQCRLLRQPEIELTTEMVRRSVQHKLDVTNEDPLETGARIVLNYGHTVAHALESVTNFAVFAHGEAVSIGMVAAAEISVQMGLLDRAVARRQRDCLEAFGLPTSVRAFMPSPIPIDAIMEAIGHDKKARRGTTRWVLLEDVGRWTVRSDVPIPLVRDVVASLE